MNWSMVREVAWREIRTRSRTRSFRIITLIMIVAAIGGPIVAALLPDGGTDRRDVTVGVVGGDETIVPLIITDDLKVTFEDLGDASTAQVDEALKNGDIDVAVEPGPTLVWDKETDLALVGVLSIALQQRDTLQRGFELGLNPDDIAELLAPLNIEERFVEGADESDEIRQGIAFFGLMIAFILPQVYGQLIMLSVIEEKSTRVIEVLLSHIRPRTLLLGKVLGLGAMAVGQLLLLIGGLLAALLVTNAIEIPSSVWRFVPILLVSLLGGLAIYNTFFALLGSLISRQEDASQVILPTIVPLIGGYFVGQQAIIGDAASPLAKALTYIPFTAPMLLPVRVARDAIEGWEIALSIGLLVLGVLLLVRLAGRVYEFTLLHTGTRVGWAELMRLFRRRATA